MMFDRLFFAMLAVVSFSAGAVEPPREFQCGMTWGFAAKPLASGGVCAYSTLGRLFANGYLKALLKGTEAWLHQ